VVVTTGKLGKILVWLITTGKLGEIRHARTSTATSYGSVRMRGRIYLVKFTSHLLVSVPRTVTKPPYGWLNYGILALRLMSGFVLGSVPSLL
jgi:hypothetical protein